MGNNDTLEQLEAAREYTVELEETNAGLAAVIEQAKALHWANESLPGRIDCGGCFAPWPCKTARALEVADTEAALTAWHAKQHEGEEFILIGNNLAVTVNKCTCGSPLGVYPHEPYCGVEKIGELDLAENDAKVTAAERERCAQIAASEESPFHHVLDTEAFWRAQSVIAAAIRGGEGS